MIVSHQNHFIFIRVPKTASTSMEIGLSSFCGAQDIITPITFRNDTDNEVRDYRGAQNTMRSILTYTLDDWYRLLARHEEMDYRHANASQVKRLVGNKVWDRYYKFCLVRNPFDRAISFYFWRTKNWEKKQHIPLPDINEFILALPDNRLASWSRYTINNKIAMDFIGKFENLSSELEKIKTALELPSLDIPHTKSSIRTDRRHYTEILNSKTRSHIEKLCAREISAFGYNWDSSPRP